jgi:hypothetical protein
MPYFSSKKSLLPVDWHSSSESANRDPVYLGYWRWFVKARTEKNEPEQVDKKITHPRVLLFHTLICLWRTPAAMRQFAAPLRLAIDTII